MNTMRLSTNTIKLPTMQISMVGNVGGAKYSWEYCNFMDADNNRFVDADNQPFTVKDYKVKID